jgi:hypothetical protein
VTEKSIKTDKKTRYYKQIERHLNSQGFAFKVKIREIPKINNQK